MFDFIKYIKYLQTDIFSVPFIGIDISDASLHYAKAKPHFNSLPAIEFFGSEAVPAGIIESGEIKKEKELSEIVRRVLSGLPGGSHFIVAALPEEKAFIKTIQIPALENKKELKNAIRFETETSIPLSASEMYFDYKDAPSQNKMSDHRDINIIAYPKILVDSYLRVFKQAGARIAALELESQSVLRALIAPERDKSVMIIDIGRTKAGFIMYSESSLVFTSTLPIGGEDFEKAIQKSLSVDEAEARRIKISIGLSIKDMGGKVFRALEPLISAIIDEAEKDINFFEHHARHIHGESFALQKIILCGGDAHLLGLIELMAERTHLPVEAGNPLRLFMDNENTRALEHEALSFATALGTALRSFR